MIENLGIDYRKELEVFFGIPIGNGQHLYMGWFYFVGKVCGAYGKPNPAGVFDHFVTQNGPGPQTAFGDYPVVLLEFRASVPWRLAEPWSDSGTRFEIKAGRMRRV